MNPYSREAIIEATPSDGVVSLPSNTLEPSSSGLPPLEAADEPEEEADSDDGEASEDEKQQEEEKDTVFVTSM